MHILPQLKKKSGEKFLSGFCGLPKTLSMKMRDRLLKTQPTVGYPWHSQKDWRSRGRGCCGASWWAHCIMVLSCWRTCLSWPSVSSYFSQLWVMTPSLSPVSLALLSLDFLNSEGRASPMQVFCSLHVPGRHPGCVGFSPSCGRQRTQWVIQELLCLNIPGNHLFPLFSFLAD